MTASHHELDLEALEHLSQGAHSMGTSAVAACEMITGVVVLATCNRFELYLDVLDRAAPGGNRRLRTEVDLRHAAAEIARLIAGVSSIDERSVRSAFTVRTEQEVTEHLFSVASGLDSMVVGEREIAGQVRRALANAHAERTTSPRLERLFQTASRTSKRVAYDTHLGSDGRSIVSVGLDLAEASTPPWRQTSVVIVGTGAYAGATVAALRSRGCVDIAVFSSSGRAEQFARSHGIVATDDLAQAVGAADLVVSCSGAGVSRRSGDAGRIQPADPTVVALQTGSMRLEYILEAAAVRAARERAAESVGEETPTRPLVVLDLALHHDVDPRVGDIDQVLLMDLGTIRSNAPSASSEPVRAARKIIAETAQAFDISETERGADGAIIALRYRIEAEVTAELARTASQFSTPADVAAYERSLRRLAGTMLHRGIMQIREAVREGRPADIAAHEMGNIIALRAGSLAAAERGEVPITAAG